MLPHNQGHTRTITDALLARDFTFLPVDTVAQICALAKNAWQVQLQSASERGEHKLELRLLTGSVFKLWPRLAACLGDSLQVRRQAAGQAAGAAAAARRRAPPASS